MKKYIIIVNVGDGQHNVKIIIYLCFLQLYCKNGLKTNGILLKQNVYFFLLVILNDHTSLTVRINAL